MARSQYEPGPWARVRGARVRAQIECLRRLPPGTEVQLEREGYGFLWETLSSLPASADPFRWAASTGVSQFALLTLQQCLEEAEHLLRGERQLRLEGFPLPPLPESLGRLCARAREMEPWNVASPSAADAEARIRVLADAADVPRTRFPDASRGEPRSVPLLVDLLRLPRDVSPLQWLQEERAAACALRGWDSLVNRVRPLPEELLVSGTAAPSVRLHGNASSRDIKVIAEKVTYFRHGFALRLTARVRVPQSLRRGHLGWAQWEGFDQAIDDRGYAYLVRESRVHSRGRNRFRSWEETIMLVAYPSPTGAKEIVWRSQSALALLNRVSKDTADVTPGAGLLELGDVEWRMPVPLVDA